VLAAHLLAPTDPARAVVDVLHSRVAEDSDWGPQVDSLRELCGMPRLVNHWSLPDLPVPALRRVLTGHTGWVSAVAIAPDGSWLATGDGGGMVRIWESNAAEQARAVLVGHGRAVFAVDIAPDGSWLSTASDDGTARIWDAAAGQQRAVLTGHREGVYSIAIAPDGTWLVTGGRDGTARIWDAATGQQRAVLTCGCRKPLPPGQIRGERLGSGPVPGGRWAGLRPAVRAMIFGLWA
jgi:WD40 repeat protein